MSRTIAKIIWQNEAPSQRVLGKFLKNYLCGIGTSEFGRDNSGQSKYVKLTIASPCAAWYSVWVDRR